MDEENIIRYMKAQKITMFGHIQLRIPEVILKKMVEWRPTRGKPQTRWEDLKWADKRGFVS